MMKTYKPAKKSPELTKFFNQTVDRTAMIEKSMCVACHLGIKEFRDKESKHEYTMSGLCQDCQDHILGNSEE